MGKTDPPEWIFQWGGIWVCTKAGNFYRNSSWSFSLKMATLGWTPPFLDISAETRCSLLPSVI